VAHDLDGDAALLAPDVGRRMAGDLAIHPRTISLEQDQAWHLRLLAEKAQKARALSLRKRN
jgi:hypothetical protein